MLFFGGRYKKDLVFFKNAVHSVRADKYRKGDIIVLPRKGDVIISGDIHGNLDNFERIQDLANLDEHPDRHVVIHELIHNIYNQDFQGDFSYECLSAAAAYKQDFPDQVHIILGNHELCELQGREIMKDGLKIPLVFSNKSVRSMGRYASILQETCKQFIKNLPVGVMMPNGVWFSHSTPERLLYKFSLGMFMGGTTDIGPRGFQKMSEAYKSEVVEDLVWGRDYAAPTASQFASKVKAGVLVVGHTPCGKKGYSVPNPHHVIIDSKDSNAVFLYLRLDKKYNQKGVVANIRKLWK